MKSLHRKPENCTGTCKVLKSTMMSVTWIVHSTPLRVGEWFGNMDLLVAPLEDHAMILGLDFLRLSKAAPLIHESHLVFLDEARTPSTPLTMKRKLRRMPRIFVIRLVEGVSGAHDKPCNMTQQQEVIHTTTSLSSLGQEEKQLMVMKTSVKTTMGKVGQLRNLHNHEHECKRQLDSSLSMEQGEHHQVNSHQQQVMDIVEDWVADLPTTKTPRVEPRQCMEALTQPDLETNVEEVGVEDRHPTTIMNFCRKAMGIYDFQLTAE
jgi:hypothetical protein